jgi:hypothetical protein
MQRYEEALAGLNRAIELDPGEYWAIGRSAAPTGR